MFNSEGLWIPDDGNPWGRKKPDMIKSIKWGGQGTNLYFDGVLFPWCISEDGISLSSARFSAYYTMDVTLMVDRGFKMIRTD